jgi:hypothetical protein
MDIELKSKIKMKLKIVGSILVFTLTYLFFIVILYVLGYFVNGIVSGLLSYSANPIMMPDENSITMFDKGVSLISVLFATKICMYFF